MRDRVSSFDLQAAADIESFLKKPLGRYVVGRTFAFWQLKDGMNGVVVWGAPTADDVQDMVRVFDIARIHPTIGPHVSLVDTRDITGIDGAAFTKLLSYLDGRRDLYAHLVVRQAFVVQRGVFGAAFSGLYQLVGARHPNKSFTDPRQAIEWLDPPDLDLAWHVFASLRERVCCDTPVVVTRLRAILEAEPGRLSLDEAARRLAVSSRTLQRRLAEANTSLRKELVAALRSRR